MRIDQQLLMILLSEKEPVSAKKLAFSLGVSEKTVQKYTAQLKTILEGHGAQLITRQRVVLIGQDKHLGRQTFDAYPFFLSIDLFDLKNMINDL